MLTFLGANLVISLLGIAVGAIGLTQWRKAELQTNVALVGDIGEPHKDNAIWCFLFSFLCLVVNTILVYVVIQSAV